MSKHATDPIRDRPHVHQGPGREGRYPKGGGETRKNGDQEIFELSECGQPSMAQDR